jgi:hypothetical protein
MAGREGNMCFPRNYFPPTTLYIKLPYLTRYLVIPSTVSISIEVDRFEWSPSEPKASEGII